MATTEWMLKAPPALCQLRLYKGTEAMFACWATCSEMVIKWKNPNAWFGRPSFDMYLGSDIDSRAKYLAMILDYFDKRGFKPQNSGGFGSWDMALMASYLYWRGPLVAHGKFTDGLAVDQMHSIAVFGCKGGLVHYIDPMDATSKTIGMAVFQQKLWKSFSAVVAHRGNFRDA
jgi:hypothetical protein